MKRAYSVLSIKEFDDEQRVIRGMATTPTADRVGDVVEPMGVRVADDIPLFLYHDSTKTVGRAKFGKATKDGIPFEARLPHVAESGALRDRVEEAWQLVKYRLVTGVSIGFRVLNDAIELMKDGGIRFLESEVMELSLVPIPANAEATILSIKSLDLAQRARLGGSVSYGNSTSPGVPGKSTSLKGPQMNLRDQIGALEAKRAANAARREEVQKAAITRGETKNQAEQEEFDTLGEQNKSIDKELVDLRELEKDAVTKAVVVDGGTPERAAASRTSVEVKGAYAYSSPNVEKGIGMARVAMALHRAAGDRVTAAQIFRSEKRWMDQTPHGEIYLKNAVAAGDTTTSGWASQLAYARDLESEFVDYLRPKTVIGRIQNLRRVPFNIRYGTQTAGVTGSWVGQGLPVPVAKPTYSSGSLGIAKASVIVAIDEELAKLSTPSAEMLVRDDMAKGVQEFLDRQFLDPNVAASANVSPASITNGVTATAATGTAAANVRTDLATMLTALSRTDMDMSSVVLIMSPETAMQIGLMVTSLGVIQFPNLGLDGGSLLGIPVITSNCANISGSPASGRMIIAAVASEIQLADEGGVSIDVSNQTALQLLDNPTNASTGSTVATSMVSMFQTHSLALRCTRFINWAKRRTTAVEYIKEAGYLA